MARLSAKVLVSLCAIVTLFAAVEVRCTTTDHDEHESWEVAKVYDLESDTYTTTISPHDGENEFDDEYVAFMVVPTSSADDEGLHKAEELAEEGETSNLSDVSHAIHCRAICKFTPVGLRQPHDFSSSDVRTDEGTTVNIRGQMGSIWSDSLNST